MGDKGSSLVIANKRHIKNTPLTAKQFDIINQYAEQELSLPHGADIDYIHVN